MEVQKWSSFPQRLQQAAQTSPGDQELDNMDLKRGPWTVDEDLVLVGYIAKHGEGRWNSLARSAGLKRTGKSCRLRWLNYLRPDVRRGNLTPEEQLLILELHSRWGNRWSKIAQYLPGRTDNEIKNYWRTRVQKHAKHLNCDVGSNKFKDAMRYLWMPRLLERIRAASCRGRPSTAASMQADVHGKVRTSTPNHHIPLESSDVDDPPAGSSMMSNAVGSAAGELMRSPSSDSGALVSQHDQALQDDAVWAIECSVPESLDGVHGALRDQLQQQCDLDEWGSGDMFVDDFWSFEDIWSMEEGMF